MNLVSTLHDVPRYAELAAPVQVVPLDGDASKFVAGHVELDAMVFLEEIPEEVKVLDANVFNAKVVDYEAELEGTPFVVPEARRRCCFIKTFGNQTGVEQVVGQDACLRESIAATVNFKVDPAIAVTSKEVVFINEVIWNVGELIRTYSGSGMGVSR